MAEEKIEEAVGLRGKGNGYGPLHRKLWTVDGPVSVLLSCCRAAICA